MQVAMASEDRRGLDVPMPAPVNPTGVESKIDFERLKKILHRETVPRMCLEPVPELNNARDFEKLREVRALSDAALDEKITAFRGHIQSLNAKDNNQKLQHQLQLFTQEKEEREKRQANNSKSDMKGKTVPVAESSRNQSQETTVTNSPNQTMTSGNYMQRLGHGGQQSERTLSGEQAGPSCQKSLPIVNGLEVRTCSGQQAGPSGQQAGPSSQQSRATANWPQLSICRRSSMVLRSSKETRRLVTRRPSQLGASTVVDTQRTEKRIGDPPAIGQSMDTAMELFSSDDEGSEQAPLSPSTKIPGSGRSRRHGLRPSTTFSLEQRTIAYPSRDDPDAIEVPSSDLQRLAPLEFLNDTIIDFYIKYIQTFEENGKDKERFHFFNSFFYKKLSDIVHQKAKRGENKDSKENKEKEILKMQKWTKGTDIFDKAYLFVPVHDNLHWSLAIICLPPSPDGDSQYDPCIYHLDSMQPGHNSQYIFKALRMYLVAEWRHRLEQERTGSNSPGSDSPLSKKLKMSAETFQAKRVPVPQQENESDCGLFLLHYIERFIKDSPSHLRWGDSPHDKLFGRKWFDPQEASSLRHTIRALLESLFEAEEKAGSGVSRLGKESLVAEIEEECDMVTVNDKESKPEAKDKSCSEDDFQLVVDLVTPEGRISGPESAPRSLCGPDSVVQSPKGCAEGIHSSSDCVTQSPKEAER